MLQATIVHKARYSVILLQSPFIGNLSAGEGGGIAGAGTIINCIFSGNSAEGEGGGIHILRPPQPMSGNSASIVQQVTIITNCTIFGNTAHGGGGIYNSGGDRYQPILLSGGTVIVMEWVSHRRFMVSEYLIIVVSKVGQVL